MTSLLPGIWQWSWYSEDKHLNFNGLILHVGEHRIMVDPPPMTDADKAQVRRGGAIDYILLTNRDHEREAESLRKEFECKVYVPDGDVSQMQLKADKTYKDQELLPGGIWAIHLHHQKSPGESAFFLQQGRGILIVGDAVIGREPGQLTMLSPDKYADPNLAREGLQRLLKYQFDTILVGDGTNVLSGGRAALEQLLHP